MNYRSLTQINRRAGTRYALPVMSLILVIGVVLAACTAPTTAVAPGNPQVPAAAPSYAGKKIVFVDSYHEGYAWSDGITNGIRKVLDGTGVELKILRLDTKRNPSEAFAQQAALQAKTEIDAFKPDVLIAADDNAQKYLVVPFYKGTSLPVIFAGVNWDASIHGYPTSNVTGMVEVELPGEVVNQLRQYAKGNRLGLLTIDSETERRVVDIYNQRFFDGKLKPYWAKTQAEFMQAFRQAQTEVDILFMGNNAGSDRWDEAEMRQFTLTETKIPTGSIYDWMAPYTLVTLAKSPEEQGEWSAQSALRVLGGTAVTAIPVVENKKGQLILNLELADKLGVVFAPSMLKNAVVYKAPTGN